MWFSFRVKEVPFPPPCLSLHGNSFDHEASTGRGGARVFAGLLSIPSALGLGN